MTRLIAGFCFILASLTLSHASDLKDRQGWVIHKTGYAYNDLVKRVRASVKNNKMGLVTTATASGGAKKQGITILGNRIIGVYRNDFARRMLKASIAAGIEAPVRFYITENEGGTATLSYKTPTHVFSPYFSDKAADLKVLASELDTIFAEIAKEAISQ